VGASGRPSLHQPSPSRGQHSAEPSGRPVGRHGPTAQGSWHASPCYCPVPQGHPQLLARGFHGDEVADRPRTTNALEQSCGTPRYHERRTTGRQTATAALGGRGAVRLVACAATRLGAVSPEARVPHDLNAWKTRRRDLAAQRQSRTLQRRFRRDSTASLARMESQLLQLSLPP
jgi:hypothetical protein